MSSRRFTSGSNRTIEISKDCHKHSTQSCSLAYITSISNGRDNDDAGAANDSPEEEGYTIIQMISTNIMMLMMSMWEFPNTGLQ